MHVSLSLCAQINGGRTEIRNNDTEKAKDAIESMFRLPEARSPLPPREPHLRISEKGNWGFVHPQIGRLLVPVRTKEEIEESGLNDDQ